MAQFMGNCLGQDNSGLSQGLVPSGGMLVGAPEKPVDPDDPWKDWYYNDYDQPAMVDGRMQSGRWDMSRESFAGKLEEKQRIQQSLAQKAQLDKANAALAQQRKVAVGQSPPPQAQQQYRPSPGAAGGGAMAPGGRPSEFALPNTHTHTYRRAHPYSERPTRLQPSGDVLTHRCALSVLRHLLCCACLALLCSARFSGGGKPWSWSWSWRRRWSRWNEPAAGAGGGQRDRP